MKDFFRYHGVWSPGVRLFRHLKFRAKAALISLVLLIPGIVFGIAFLSDTQEQIRFAAKEREGIAAMKQMVPLLHAVLETRNATRATLGGHDVTADYVAARKRVDTALDAFEAQLRSSADPLGLTPKLTALRKAWVATATSKNGADDKGRTVFGPVSEAAIAVLQGISDDSNLVLDPDIDTLYTILATFITLPKTAEDLGQVWGWGTYGVSHGGLDNPEQYARYSVWMARATGGIDDALTAFQRAFAANAALKERIDLNGLKAAKTFAATASVADRIKAADEPAEFYAAGRKALGQYFKVFDSVLPALDDLLSQREQRLTLQRNLRIAVVALALLLSAYLFTCFAKVMDGGLEEVARHLDSMADGDLTRTPRPWGNDEAAHLLHSLGRTQVAMQQLVQNVRDVSGTIVVASSQIAQGAGDLSTRTERAAAGLQETASSLDQIASSLAGTTASTERTTHVAGDNVVAADAGGRVIAEAVQTMSQLREVSTRIRDIIGTIDGIAFQTNILALNAAVEAARAGEQGRGFAVVAGEVRSLAQRSAQAAREIKSLITDSVERMQAGTAVVEQAGQKVQDMRSGAQVISQLIADIAGSAQRQNAGVQAIGKTVFDLDRMTQENAALVEETAAASDALHQRAQELEGAVSRFKLPGARSFSAPIPS